MSEPRRTELSNSAADYLTGPVAGESARTEGGTTRDGAVAVFGANRDGDRDLTEQQQQIQTQTAEGQTNPPDDTTTRS